VASYWKSRSFAFSKSTLSEIQIISFRLPNPKALLKQSHPVVESSTRRLFPFATSWIKHVVLLLKPEFPKART
jgi:hypothetical protein